MSTMQTWHPSTMGAQGLIIYRLRGCYYSEYIFRDSDPRGLGREIVKNIPADLDKFQVWKQAKVAFYRSVENRIRRLARDSPLLDFRDPSEWCYHGEPYREYILRNTSIEWIYAIDLDEDVLRVSGYNRRRSKRSRSQHWVEQFKTKYFRLDNIPRWLFDLDDRFFDDNDGLGPVVVHPILLTSSKNIPAEYWAHHLRTPPEPDLKLLELYERCSPQPMPPGPQDRDISVWAYLRLLLLGDVFEHFIRAFQDVGAYGRKSTFVFRQLAYAIISLAQGGKCIQFQGHNPQDMIRILSTDFVSPGWEPPDTNAYWVGDVLIVLNEHIKHEQSKCAAIGRVIQLTSTSTSSTDVMAVLFSISRIVLVKISHTAHGCAVSHTSTLPLFTADMETSAFTRKKYQTPGIMALLGLWSHTPPPAVSHPGNLPIEICHQIFQLADPASQRALRHSCRLFHQVALDRPHIGEWTLLGYRGGHEFIAFSSLCGGMRVVRVERMEPGIHKGSSAFKTGVWRGGEVAVFGIPLFRVENRGYV